jgi:hypothetical protein
VTLQSLKQGVTGAQAGHRVPRFFMGFRVIPEIDNGSALARRGRDLGFAGMPGHAGAVRRPPASRPRRARPKTWVTPKIVELRIPRK